MKYTRYVGIYRVTLTEIAMVHVALYLCNSVHNLQALQSKESKNFLISSPCRLLNSNVPKRWGKKCQHLCNCRNNTQCLSSGICPGGCEKGWESRGNRFGLCVMSASKTVKSNSDVNNEGNSVVNAKTRKDIQGMAEDTVDSLVSKSSDNRVRIDKRKSKQYRGMNRYPVSYDKYGYPLSKTANVDEDRHYRQERDVSKTNHSKDIQMYKYFTVYSYTSVMLCETIDNTMFLSLIYRPASALWIKNFYFRLNVELRGNKFKPVKLQCYLNDHSNMTHLMGMKYSVDIEGKVFTIQLQSPIMCDKMLFSLEVKPTVKCEKFFVSASIMLYALPICPYRRWGVHCELYCMCNCGEPECHPITGGCGTNLNMCSEGTFGKNCEKKCSNSCKVKDLVKGNTIDKRCHRVSGYCRKCSNLNQVGKTCEKLLPPGEVAAILENCVNDTVDRRGPANIGFLMGPVPSSGFTDADNRGKIALLVVASVILLIIIGFTIYVSCVRCLARRRMRNHMKRLDRQRMLRTSIKSWSDLREEFREHGFRTSVLSGLSNKKARMSAVSGTLSGAAILALGPRQSAMSDNMYDVADSCVDPTSDEDDNTGIKKVSFR